MTDLMTRDQAMALLTEHVSADNLIKHCLATEAIMRALAGKLDENQDLWGIAGLLHDLDFESTKDDPASHGRCTEAILREAAATHPLPEEAIAAILGHNAEALGIERDGPFAHALTAAETLTGLIVATALVYPDKKVGSVKVKSVTKRMKQTAFARNVNREHILSCEQIGIPLGDFVEIGLEAMKGIAPQLGL